MNYYLVGGTVELELPFENDWAGVTSQMDRLWIEPRLICAEDKAQAQTLVLAQIMQDKGAIDGEWLRVDVVPEPADRAMRRMGAPMLPGLANV